MENAVIEISTDSLLQPAVGLIKKLYGSYIVETERVCLTVRSLVRLLGVANVGESGAMARHRLQRLCHPVNKNTLAQ